ncbi:acyl-CoA dehydrogenase family protein [Actinomycetospora sp. TBRC 11914]|uniref:acyl-CoA dehydrogenase family protein n=1 Tax=Actinomycetospora sp. TBRC 11914 TaxID=2729387 RepID=UPI00145EB517|nr:acyl-CoA dehydrogenase family protein [Actinomycetospora sp. TBRC 11914]NMO88202.1 acyl-CoA/acyl-ACP dehydrogenase [Actinomycetospora sp. TBRC 11914]
MTTDADPVALAREVTDMLLLNAADADDPAIGVQRSMLRCLAAQGLYSVAAPVADGGLGHDERTLAEVEEVLAGADAATWFVMTQHWSPQGLTAGSSYPAADEYRRALAHGDELGGIAIAHVRRPGTPAVRAEPDGHGGWRFRGRAEWCTGWGLVDLVLIAAISDDDRVVFALLPAHERRGLRASAPYALAVMGGTRTVGLEFSDMPVAGSEVAAIVDREEWRRRDGDTVVDTKPATMGLLRRVIDETVRTGHERDRPAALEEAQALAALACPLRERAYELRFSPDRRRFVEERLSLRGRIAELMVRAAAGLVAARGGSAMYASSPEQRWHREAMFHLVQAQTEDVRAAQLAAFSLP